MIYLNRHQPRRPDRHPVTKEKLMFRTFPRMGESHGRVYRLAEPPHRIAQMLLYRWTYSDSFVLTPAMGDLYDFLVGQFELQKVVSKKSFGGTIVNALDYECRKLRGLSKTNDKVRQIYCLVLNI